MASKPSKGRSGERIVITGTGMVTAVGHDRIMAPASIRAGISRFSEIPTFVTETGAKSAGGLIYGITDDRSGTDRLLAMAGPAMQEALFAAEGYSDDLDMGRGRLLLSICPPERPTYEEFQTDDLQILLESAEAEGLSSVEFIRDGHAGGVVAFSKSMALLREEKAEFCIVGGIDSLVEYPSMAWLEDAGRVMTDDRPHGFIPGEAAAFLLLELESSARRRGVPIHCELLDTAYTIEEATRFSDKPLLGKALADSINAILSKQGTGPEGIDGILCDLNGEHYRMKEWGLAQCRVFDGLSLLPELWHPAENIGDVGAASAVLLAAVAESAIGKGYFKGPRVLVWTSSDTGGRGSVLLTSYSPESGRW
jgi:3-oxoacyl-[acyl-carrier-protein] synthase-1